MYSHNSERISLLINRSGIIASIARTVVFAKTFAEAGPLSDVTWNHVSLINWTMIEPGMYLLSACALSFKPLLCSFAKALNLQAFVTHTRSTAGGTRSHVKKTFTSTQTQSEAFELEIVRKGWEFGKFHRLSNDSGDTCGGPRGNGKSEVIIAKPVVLDSETREDDMEQSYHDLTSIHFGRAL